MSNRIPSTLAALGLAVMAAALPHGWAAMPNHPALPVALADDDSKKLSIALREILDAAPQQFKSLRAGAGKKLDDYTIYPCAVEVPGAMETEVWFSKDPEDLPVVRASVYSGKDGDAAGTAYGDWTRRLKAALPGWASGERTRESERTRSQTLSFTKDEGGASISLMWFHVVSIRSNRVTVTVHSPDKVE